MNPRHEELKTEEKTKPKADIDTGVQQPIHVNRNIYKTHVSTDGDGRWDDGAQRSCRRAILGGMGWDHREQHRLHVIACVRVR